MAEGAGDFDGGEASAGGGGLRFFVFHDSTWSFSLCESSIVCRTSLREAVARESTRASISFDGTVSSDLTRRMSSPVNTSFLTTGVKAASSS